MHLGSSSQGQLTGCSSCSRQGVHPAQAPAVSLACSPALAHNSILCVIPAQVPSNAHTCFWGIQPLPGAGEAEHNTEPPAEATLGQWPGTRPGTAGPHTAAPEPEASSNPLFELARQESSADAAETPAMRTLQHRPRGQAEHPAYQMIGQAHGLAAQALQRQALQSATDGEAAAANPLFELQQAAAPDSQDGLAQLADGDAFSAWLVRLALG